MFRLIGFLSGVALTLLLLTLWQRPGLIDAQQIIRRVQAIVDAPVPVKTTPAPLAGTQSAARPATAAGRPQQPDGAAIPTPRPVEPALQRQLFWSPFRSERAARGFADGIGQRSGLAIRVIRRAPLRYRLAFDYRGEAQRLARLAQIETVTGLDLSEWRKER